MASYPNLRALLRLPDDSLLDDNAQPLPAAPPMVTPPVAAPLISPPLAGKNDIAPGAGAAFGLGSAQKQDRDAAMAGVLGRALGGAGDLIASASSPRAQYLPASQATFDALDKARGSKAQDLLQGRAAEEQQFKFGQEQKTAAVADQLRKQQMDPSSDLNKNARAALMATPQGRVYAKAFGPAFERMTAEQITKLAPAAKDLLEADTKAAHDKIEMAQKEAERDVERAKAAETKRHNIAEEGLSRTKEEKAHEPKPIPENEASKIVNMNESLKAIDDLEKMHEKVGLSGLAPLGNTAGKQYNDAKNALAGQIAAGALPAARETPALMEEFKRSFPSGIGSHEAAKAFFNRLRETVRSNSKAQIAALKAGNYSPKQIEELERNAGAASPAAEPPHGQTVVQDGHTFNWNPATGKYE